MKKFLLIVIFIIGVYPVVAQSDEIPNNCPYQNGVFYQQNLFPRYEFHNQRVVIVDWSTGAEVRELATGIQATDYRVQLWSPECQYLAMGFATLNENGVELWDTYVWDVVNGTQLILFEDARLSPYPLTWDTNSTQLLVETRFGAYLWKLNGEQVWLSSDTDYNAHSFQLGTVRWDYANNQVSGILSIAPYGTAVYDMSSGALLSLTDQFGRTLSLETLSNSDVQANENGERYPCRASRYSYYGVAPDGLRVLYEPHLNSLVLRDANTRDLVRVVDDQLSNQLENTRLYNVSWFNDCRYLRVTFGRYGWDTILYDMQNGERVLVIEDAIIRQFDMDPTGNYVVVTTRNGTNLYYLATGHSTPLIPDVRTSAYGSGRVWSYDAIEWDVANQQVRLTTALDHSNYVNSAFQIHVYDLTTGTLVVILDREGHPADAEQIQAVEEQRTAPFGCRWRMDYQLHNQRLVLKDAVTHDLITVVEDQLLVNEFRNLGRSPDCRYIAAAIGNGNQFDTVVWDLVLGQRVGVFADAHEIPHRINWSPYGGYVIVHTRNGGYLWYLPEDIRLPLNQGVINDNAATRRPVTVFNFYEIEWDMMAGQLLAVPVENPETVVAYNLSTGTPVAEYGIQERTAPVDFIQLDASRLIVYTTYAARDSEHRVNGLALWNRATNSGIQLAMDFYVAPTATNRYTRGYPQFSPDGSRVMMRSLNFVYIWDLNALAGDAPHLPNYVHQLTSTRDVYFVDNGTITSCKETTSPQQMARRTVEITTYIYDVVSGALLSETPATKGYNYFEWIRFPC